MSHLSLLIFRVVIGFGLLFGHGLDKLMHFSERAQMFPSVFGLGSTVSLSFAVFAEVFCAFAVLIGLASRLAAIPVVATLGVAFLMIHAGDPFSRKELALLYLVSYGFILWNGAGRYSVDALLGTDGFLRRRRT